MSKLELYTVLVECEGGSYVSQFMAADETAALLCWCDAFMKGEGVPKNLSRLPNAVRKELSGWHKPESLMGVSHAGCLTVTYRSKFTLFNIVKTVGNFDSPLPTAEFPNEFLR